MNIKKFPTLFKKTCSNKIYQWNIKIEDNNDNTYTIITSHGERNGKMVGHSKKISKGKANRSVLEQAILDSTSKWNSKYNKEGYRETINMNSRPVVRPMLANTFKFDSLTKKSRAKKIKLPCAIQRKYDGIRCLAYNDNNKIILESRKGVKFENFNLLKKELQTLFLGFGKNFYLDGELYTDSIPFESLSGLIRKKENKTSEKELEDINKIKFYIYDCFDIDKMGTSFTSRCDLISVIFGKNINYCVRVPTYIAETGDDIKKYHKQFISEGFEGTMLRNLDSVYEPNKRSKDLQKYKDNMEEEYKIIGFHEGSGDEKGAVIWDCVTKEGKQFAVRPVGSRELRQTLYKNGEKYIGSLLTVIFQELTNDGIPRFPRGKAIRDIY